MITFIDVSLAELISEEDSKLYNAINSQSSARSEVYRLNNQSAKLTQHQQEQLESNLKVMMDQETEISKLKTSLRKRRETVDADQALNDRMLNELKHSAELFQPPKAVQVQA